MSDNSAGAGAAEPEIETARRSLLSRVSIVWLVPVVALLISLAVVWQSYANRGTLIQLRFADASGVRADETQLRYRDVVVGVVETVTFTDDLESVLIDVLVDQNIAPYIDADAKFWIVSPEVSAQGVTGLDTVLGGVYIQGAWDSTIAADDAPTTFAGLARAPLNVYAEEGVTFQLRGTDATGLNDNAPILYRGITVGRVGNLRLAEDGVSVIADAFVRAPESRLVNSATRFWDTSGFTFRFGAQGATLDVNSLSSLVSGGVAFETSVSGGAGLAENPVFRLYPDAEAARASVFGNTGGEPVSFTVVFDDSVPGLEVGANVEFGGIRVGRVAALTGILDETQFGDGGVRLLVTLELQPGQMGLEPDAAPEDVLDFLQFAVANGLRAQLQSASLLGGLQVSLDQFDDVPPAAIEVEAEPYPRLPSIPAEISDFTDTAEGVFRRVNALPIEELLDNANRVMVNVNRLLSSEGVIETPEEVLALLGDIRALIASDAIQGLPGQAAGTMGALQSTAEELQGVVRQLSEADAVAALVSALDAAEEAANAVYEAVDEMPETLATVDAAVAEIETLIATVNRLPLESVVAEVEGSVAALRELLAAPATQGLTGDVSDLLGEVEGLVAEIRAAGLVETATATLDEARAAVTELSARVGPLLDEAQRALVTAQATIDGVPEVVENVERLTADLDTFVLGLNDLPLDAVIANLNSLLTSIDVIASAESTQAVPERVNALLSEARGLVAQLAESGLIAQANDTLIATETAVNDIVAALRPVLDEARRAAESLAAAADTAPEIAERAKRVADRIELFVNDAADLPLEEIGARASTLLQSADALISSAETQRLPGALSDALDEANRLLVQIQEGGVVENASDALASIGDAADRLPVLLDDVGALLTRTGDVVGGYQSDGPLGTQVRSALREIRQAASSVDSLARQIERSPNSLLFGR